MARPVRRRAGLVLAVVVAAFLACGPWGPIQAAAAGTTAPPPAPAPPAAAASGGQVAGGSAPAPAAVPPAPPSGTAAVPPAPPSGTAASGGSSGTLAKALGLAALLIVLVLYSEGFGVLGGRVRPLSARRPSRQAGGRSEPA